MQFKRKLGERSIAARRCHSRKQIRAGLGELHVSAALMHFEPATPDRQVEPGAVFGRRGLQIEQKWRVEQFNVDAPVLHGLNRAGAPAA
jgi:hypothetical protein